MEEDMELNEVFIKPVDKRVDILNSVPVLDLDEFCAEYNVELTLEDGIITDVGYRK